MLNGPRETLEPTSRPRLTIVIVNYESWPDIVRLVSSIRDEPEVAAGQCEAVVVDNASPGPVPPLIASPPAGIRLIARPDNGGFAAGVNAGWRAARSPWLLVLNPDIDIAPGFVRSVFECIDRLESRAAGVPGIIGFGLTNPDGSAQGSVGWFPSLARSIREQFIPRTRRKYQPDRRIRPGVVDWVTGACMLVNARLIAEVGGMDEDFFLYYEEVAFCRVASQRGWRVEFDPTLRFVHRHPLQNRPISPKMRVITRHSKLLYFYKHLPRWQFRSLTAIVRLESVIRGGYSAIRGDAEEAGAWAAIAGIARQFDLGRPAVGTDVLAIADAGVRRERGWFGKTSKVGGTSGDQRRGRLRRRKGRIRHEAHGR